ncbi:hypothetical protein [Kordiimonas gwangyangensis]|uniref:hypothetical protein n=1 Tax=Kordiimonas gwangyangensis TaxID=288022 RepID=UPI0003A3D0B7|nr:hypothetical protein [Kordiimonas gwangyangensis]
MKKIALLTASLLTTATIFPSSATADAEDDKEICLYYGNVGAAAVEFLLPLKLQQVVDLISGRDEALLEKMNKTVEGVGNVRVKTAMKKIGDDAAEHLGASAGFLSFQLVMTGQATTPQEVFSVLYRGCSETGPERIVENQRKAVQSEPQPEN